MLSKLGLEEILKPRIITCGKCGGELHIIPIKYDLGKDKFRIDTINICSKCTFKKEENNGLQTMDTRPSRGTCP